MDSSNYKNVPNEDNLTQSSVEDVEEDLTLDDEDEQELNESEDESETK